MASDIKTTSEDAEMAECDGEKVVTMMDVLQEQEDFEEDANAVLGASDDKNCTYSKGYIKRQAIYACMTCCPDAKSDPTNRAGVCLACSLMCHENHELVELYTKRNFRCDCGNPKFNSHPCTFTQDKTDLNEDNYYNQNFSGLYCTCQRPYPDPEATEEDEMIQCIICEDWLHASHLESTVPANGQYSEMICKTCMEKNDFLHDYSDLVINVENADVDVVNNSNIDANNSKLCNGDAKTDANDSDLNESITKPDIKAADENVETDSKDTLPESKEGDKVDSKDESIQKIDNSMETDQSEQTQQSDAASVNTEAQSIEKSEEVETTESETRTDLLTETSDNSQVSDDKANEENVPEQSKDQESNEVINKNEDNATEPEKSETKTEKANEQNAEQMEEDRLLADDNTKAESVENSDKTPVDFTVSSKDNNEEESKSESASTPHVSEVNNSSIEGSESKEVCNETLPQNENDSKPTAQNENSENSLQSDNITENVESPQKEGKIEESSSSEKRKHTDEEDTDDKEAKKPKLGDKCVRPKGVKKIYKGATFWPSSFRQKLCTCQECISMYNDLSVLFLTDPEDTVTAYENLGKQKINGKPTTQYEKGLQALSSLDRIQQINALTEYNKMRDKLLDFLKSFKDRKEIVKEEDIKAFFAGMRPKREPDGVYFCR